MPKKSVLQNEALVKSAVEQSASIKEALAILGLRSAGGNYKGLRDACARFSIDPPAFDKRTLTVQANLFNTIPLDQILVENSTYTNRANLKRRLIDADLLEWKCYAPGCVVQGEWNGQPLTLQLEHKNGVWNDNRVENLELLCPNCHSQTETFCGRANKQIKPKVQRATRIEWPTNDELRQRVAATSYSAVGRALGVSDNAVRKHLAK